MTLNKVEHGNGGPVDGTEYDLSSACPFCGSGAVQVGDLYLKRSEAPRKGDISRTIAGQTVVSLSLAYSLFHAGLSGFHFRSVKSSRDGSDLPWVQWFIEEHLPPMSAASSGVIRDFKKYNWGEPACAKCNRNGYFHTPEEPFQLRYDKGKVTESDLPDVLHTWEWFGYSWLSDPLKESHFGASPLLIVKPKVYQLLKQLRVRAVMFEPVEFVE